MITCDYGGGFGNQIFQYVFARIISEKLKLQLTSWPNKDFNDVIKCSSQQEYMKYEKIKYTIDDNFLYDNILKYDFKDAGYHLKGYWQHAEYYLENRDLILSFFDFKPPVDLDRKNIVAHIRLIDYSAFGYKGNILHPDYYLEALSREKYDKLYIVTDEPTNKDYFSYFKGINYEIVSLSCNHERVPQRTANDFYFIMEFDRIICGNSSFS